MDLLHQFVQIFLHLDKHLGDAVQTYQGWTYLILFAIIFCETGLVVTPFLPGDSLLFAAGSIAALDGSPLNVVWLIGLLAIAAILGDTVNYWIGHLVGPKIFHKENVRLLNKKHLERAHRFYEKYGGKTIIIARFVPIIRTFAPFVAGIGSMTYWRFITYNIVGGALWVILLVMAGWGFGQSELVKKNFTLVIMAIIVISILPAIIEFIRAKRHPEDNQATEAQRSHREE